MEIWESGSTLCTGIQQSSLLLVQIAVLPSISDDALFSHSFFPGKLTDKTYVTLEWDNTIHSQNPFLIIYKRDESANDAHTHNHIYKEELLSVIPSKLVTDN